MTLPGMRVDSLTGPRTQFGFGPRIDDATKAMPDGPLSCQPRERMTLRRQVNPLITEAFQTARESVFCAAGISGDFPVVSGAAAPMSSPLLSDG